MKKYIAIPLFIISLIIPDLSAQTNISSFPDATWLKHDPIEEIGYSSKKIKEIERFIIDSMNTTGLLVVVDGKVLFEYGDIEELSYLASCRKSLLSMLYSKYVENNTIDLEKTLEELEFDDTPGLLPIEKQAKIRHLITARSGVYHPASNSGDNTEHAPERGSVQPDSYFLYNNWDFNAAGAIFELLTGQNIYDAFEKDIAIPIKMQDFDRNAQEKSGNTERSKYLAYHFWLSTRDMARVGLLMLNNGNWNREQVISEDWIKLTTSVVTPLEQMNPLFYREGHFAYGYMWWIWQSKNKDYLDNAYLASGHFGQYIAVLPELNMVIAHKTKSDYRRYTQRKHFEKVIDEIANSRLE